MIIIIPVSSHAYTTRVVPTGGTIHIAGGAYTTPYVAATTNRTYILDGDMTCDTTCILVNTSNIVIDLNGHTLTYNQVAPGCGIASADYNKADVAIINGSIIQGVAQSEGVVYGSGSNPIRFHSGTPASYNVARVQIAGITARYGSKDVGGFSLGGDGHLVEECTIEDTYEFGTMADRHVGIAAVKLWSADSVVRNNTLINVRQRGIDLDTNGEAYGNTIGIRSIATNSSGIAVGGAYQKVHHNIITGRGEHPIGIAAGNDVIGASHDVEIYSNTIDTQVTRVGTEYGGIYPEDAITVVHPADHAVGIRCTTGTTNMFIYDNTIVVNSDSDYMGAYSPDGRPIRLSGGARGIMVGLRYNDQSMRIYNNTVTALDRDGTGYAVGLACDSNIDNNNEYSFRPPAEDYAPNLVFDNNTVTSNRLNIAFGDAYQACHGNPIFVGNTLIKSGSYSSYATYGSGYNYYYGGTGRIISSIYQSGAAENSLDMHFQALSNNIPDVGGAYRDKSIIFGDLQGDNYLYYRYRLHNSAGTTGSTTPITETINAVGPLLVLLTPETSDAIAPVTTPSPAAGKYATKQTVSLSCTDNVGCTSTQYCVTSGTTCTPATEYTAALTVYPGSTLCWDSADAAGNHGTGCSVYGWPALCR